jgi:zinc transport system substrate-binding protein
MKKILFAFLTLFSITVYAKPMVIVSILPQQTFVKKIAKDKVDITLMVKPGSSPHSYEPKPSQMISISKANVYFSIGVEFENTWLERFKAQNKNLRFVNISDGVVKIVIKNHHHGEENYDKQKHNHKGFDPHTWTSPKNVKIMAKNIYKTLAEIEII